MKNYILLIVLMLIGSASMNAQKNSPKLEYAFELKVTCSAPYSVGQTSHGERVVIPITGGTFEGPSIKGKVIGGGADYQLVDRKNGRTELEAIYSIQTDDGVFIHVRNVGILIGRQNEFYFRTVPKFEAPQDSKYNWLNDAIFICEPQATKDYISLKIWKVN